MICWLDCWRNIMTCKENCFYSHFSVWTHCKALLLELCRWTIKKLHLAGSWNLPIIALFEWSPLQYLRAAAAAAAAAASLCALIHCLDVYRGHWMSYEWGSELNTKVVRVWSGACTYVSKAICQCLDESYVSVKYGLM